jgi:hypothetical protein
LEVEFFLLPARMLKQLPVFDAACEALRIKDLYAHFPS